MKILVICYEYPPLGGGGGRIAKAIAEQLAARGHEVRIQTAALGFRSVRETIGGVEIFRTASGRRAPDTCAVHEMAAYVTTSFLPTLQHIRRWQPEVVHAHFAVPTGLLAWVVHRLTRVPYVLTAHLGDVPGGVPEQTDRLFRLIAPIARRIWRDAAQTTAVSSFVAGLAQQAYGCPPHRILNGIDLTGAPTAPSELAAPRHLMFAGRLNAQKNPVLLIEALAKVADLPWRLTFIGDGPLMPQVRAKITECGLAERVHITGWLDAAAVHGILREADILCLPSTSEGMPVAAIEALKFGLALVASDIPGVDDVLDEGVNGWRAPLGDAAAFSEKLRLLLSDDAQLRAMKRASLEKARGFDLSRIVQQYESVLQRAVLRSASPDAR